MNITDALAPYFWGDITLEEATENAAQLFVETYVKGSFVCEWCGKIIYPKVTTNEHGIFVESNSAELRGGVGNACIAKNICEACYQKVNMKG